MLTVILADHDEGNIADFMICMRTNLKNVFTICRYIPRSDIFGLGVLELRCNISGISGRLLHY